MSEGWILLHRKLQENPIWANNQPFDMRSAWVDLLLMVNHADVETVFDYKPFVVKRGQCLTSVRKLSVRWSWSKDRTLKYLKLLESLNMIHKESNNQRTLITIENYDVYQSLQDTTSDTERTRPRPRPGRKADTGKDTGSPQTNNEKNEKNENNEKNVNKYYPTDDALDKAFSDFVEFRKKIKKPMTDRAIELNMKDLEKLSGGDNDLAIKIINQSIKRGWQGLFELKEDKQQSLADQWLNA